MRKSIGLNIMLAFALVLSLFTPYSTTEAASSQSATVNVKTLNVMDKASSKAKKLGTLKMGTKVSVYAKIKSGWSEIRYKNKKAYVVTKSLKFAVVKKSTSQTAKVSYLRDKNKVYVYKEYLNNVTWSEKYMGVSKEKDWNYGFNLWEMIDGDYKGEYGAVEKETKSGLFNFAEFQVIAYPVTKNKKWKDSFGESYEITSVNQTLKTPAGTFKNVIVVKVGDWDVYYYAEKVGLIRRDNDGKKYIELVKLKNR